MASRSVTREARNLGRSASSSVSGTRRRLQDAGFAVRRRSMATAAGPAATRGRDAFSMALLGCLGLAGIFLYGQQKPALQLKNKNPVPPNMRDFKAALQEVASFLPDDCISREINDLVFHGSSTYAHHTPELLPGAVLYPRSTDDVVQITKIANRYSIPCVPFSGGTSVEGQFDAASFPLNKRRKMQHSVPLEKLKPGASFVLDFSEHMNQILEVHETDMDVVVQPGVPYEGLNEELKSRGLFFPVDPGPGAQIGGMVGTGCSGTNAVRYGTMRENVLTLKVVLPNGEIIKTRSRARKSSAGPDLTKLFIGAEGTLGFVVEATLKLSPLLPTSVGVSSFPDIQSAADTVTELVRNGIGVQCVELLDDVMTRAMITAGIAPEGSLQPTPSLMLKLAGSQEVRDMDAKRLSEIVAKHKGTPLQIAENKDVSEKLWRARKMALFAALESYPGSRAWTTDVCVPIGQLPALVAETKREMSELGLIAPICGHAGDGNFHAIVLFKDDEEMARVKVAVKNMVLRAQRMDGTCTGEHGVGHGKMDYLEAELGKGTVSLLRDIKAHLDPKNIMNPGKVVHVEYSDLKEDAWKSGSPDSL